MGTTQQMSRFIVNARFEDIPAPGVEMAKLCLLDGVGCAIYGSTRPLGKIVTELTDDLGGKPVARVVGTSIRTNAVNAAMANGILCHSEDFDGSNAQQSALMPVVFSLGEELEASGKQALLSYLVGVEISVNIRWNIGADHPAKGWHGTSSTGVLGSAAAAAKILGLNEMQTRMALGLGASQASGLRANHGTMTKSFNPGNAARGGVLAAKLAQRGYETHPDIIEHRFGYVAVYGEQMAQLSNMTRHLGHPWVVMGSGHTKALGMGVKIWPCCSGTHAALTGVSRLLKEQPFDPEEVDRIDILTTDNPPKMSANIRSPTTGLQGKFSVWYAVAALLIDRGNFDVTSFTDEAVNRPQAQKLLQRVNIAQDADMADRPGRSKGGGAWSEITITLKNGKSLKTRVEGHGDSYGWDDKDAIVAKFKRLAGSVFKPAQVDAALNAVLDMDKAASMRGIIDAITLPRR